MKAVISSTHDDKYFYFLPIVTWCWNKLGVEVICFMPPHPELDSMPVKSITVDNALRSFNAKIKIEYFSAPKHKEATYSQCSRLYGACLDLPEDEVLIISDCDMANFKIPPYLNGITILGGDLVPEGQFPMCYATGTVKEWRSALQLQYGGLSAIPENSLMNVFTKSYQQCLDELLGDIECEHMRGNYWGKDQQTLWEKTKDVALLIPRARQGTQFAENRVDRDDINWRSYVNDDLVDAHLWRDGFTEQNHSNIMELLKMKYPQEDFDWLIEYTKAYKELL